VSFTPRPYQSLIRDFILQHDRCNVWASPGTGKSSATLDAVQDMLFLGLARRVLVLGPMRVARDVWPAERDKWGFDLSIAAAVGTAEQRTAAVRSKPDVLCINYENVEWLINGHGGNWPYDMVIADESTRLKGLRIGIQVRKGKEVIVGQGSVRARALSKIAHTKTKRWVNLTGSPAPNGVVDLYGPQWFIDKGHRLGHSFTGFQQRWFYVKQSADGYPQLFPHAWAQRQIEDKLRDCTITIDARDWFDIAEPIERHIMIDLPPKARRAYESMQKDLFADIEEGRIEAFTSGGKMNKCLQFASGSVWLNDKQWAKVHDEKLDALASLKEELSGEPMLVRYVYRPDLERILKAFPRARQITDQRSIDAWNAGEVPMLVLHAASAGHGLSLQHGGRVLVDYSSDMNLEHDEQIIERIGPTRQAQSGLDRAVYRYRIVARNTIEETAVLPRLAQKISVQESLKQAMKSSCAVAQHSA
jgi:hypothetical protein